MQQVDWLKDVEAAVGKRLVDLANKVKAETPFAKKAKKKAKTANEPFL